MELGAPYPFIYQIALYSPLSMHTYLLLWDEVAIAMRSVDEDWSLYIDAETSLKTYSQYFVDLLQHLLQLNKLGCIELKSVTSDSVYVTMRDVHECFVLLDEADEAADAEEIGE